MSNGVENDSQQAAAAAAVSATPAPAKLQVDLDQETSAANTPSGSVQAFRDIRRELTPEELASPGVIKLILDRLDVALARCELLAGFEIRFHESDKTAAVLQEKLNKKTALDIAWSSGVAIGLALITLVPGLPDPVPLWVRVALTVIGLILISGGIAVRVVLR